MAARFALSTTVLVIFVLGFFAPRWMGPKSCINSSLVEEITIVVDGATVGNVTTCTPFTRSFGPELPGWFRTARIIEKVESVETLDRYWPHPDRRLKLTINKSKDSGLVFRDDFVEIGSDYFDKVGLLEKALMGYWIGLKDSMTAQIATDLLWTVHHSELPDLNSKNQTTLWTNQLVSLKAYCGLGLNVLHHEEFCQVQRELGEGLVVGSGEASAQEAPVLWSIHQIITGALAKVFVGLPLEQKASLLKKLVFLNHFDNDDSWPDISNLRSLAELDQKLWDHVNHITASLGLDSNVLWDSIKSQLITRSDRLLKYFVVRDGLSWDLKNIKPNAKSVVMLEQGVDKYLFPSDVPLRMSRASIFEALRLESVTVVGCETPRPSELLEFEPYVRKILFVKMCSGVEFRLSELLMNDQNAIVQANKDIEFVEFNLAAVRFAVKTKGTLQSSSRIIDWQKWLEWNGSIYDPERSAYRPRAAIDGINWFRTN